MKSYEIVKELVKQSDASVAGLAEALGKSRQTVWNTLKGKGRKTMSVDGLAEMLDALGYKLVIVPKTTSVKNGYEVEEL